jgi:hypothetical protein
MAFLAELSNKLDDYQKENTKIDLIILGKDKIDELFASMVTYKTENSKEGQSRVPTFDGYPIVVDHDDLNSVAFYTKVG